MTLFQINEKIKFYFSIVLLISIPFINSQEIIQKKDLNLFLNGLLDGGLIGVDMEDFSINNIDYLKLSNQVRNLMEDYKSEDILRIQNFLKTLGEVFNLISKQAEFSQFAGPTSDLLNKFAVPLVVPGDFIFTYKTSLIIYELSVSDEMYKGGNIHLADLKMLGEKLGALAAKVFYDGKYDLDIIFPLAFPSLRFLQNNDNSSNDTKPTWTKKIYQMFENKSLFDLKKTKLGNKNPNHKTLLEEAEKLKVKIIENEINSKI